jgi:hypothetical protein
MTRLGILLSLAVTALQAGLLAILVWRKIYREYPFFFSYIIFSIYSAFARLAVAQHYQVYFMVFWITAGIYAVLGLLVLDEIFRWFFSAFYRYWNWFWALFPVVSAVVLATSVWYAIYYPPIQANRVISFVLVFGIAVNLVQIGLFLLFFALVRILKLRRWEYPFAIVMGFAMAAFGALAAYLLRSEFGTKFNPVVQYAPPVAYTLAVVLWLIVFSGPEREFELGPGITRERLLEEIRQYNQYLNRLREKFK